MKLTFLLRSRSAVKTLGSVIDAAMVRDHDVSLCVQPDPRDWDAWVESDLAPWVNLPRRDDGDDGIKIGLSVYPDAEVGVPSWWDNILVQPDHGQLTCYMSEWHQKQHAQNFPGRTKFIMRQPIVGWTHADHRALIFPQFNPSAHILFSMKRRTWAQRTLRQHFLYYEAVSRAYAEAHESFSQLTIKTRAKHRDPFWLRGFGYLRGDECMYPSTSMALLSQAEAATTFSSGASLEARLFTRVKLTNYQVPLGPVGNLPGVRASYEHMWNDRLEDIITYDDTKAGHRVMDAVEAL